MIHPLILSLGEAMKPLNLPLMQIQFEVLHENITEIAHTHNVSEEMVKYAIRQHNWEQKTLTASEQAEEIDAANSNRQVALEAVHTLRQGVLDPQYIKIEAALVAKVIDVANSILPEEPTAAKRLKELTEILATLRPTKNMVKEQHNDGSINLMIMNHVGDVNKVQAKPEEIEVVINSTEVY